MLTNLKDLVGRKIHATDSELGHVEELYFEDDSWKIRYLVVKTGSWLFGRSVLISPTSVKPVDLNSRELVVTLTQDQIRSSPEIDTALPVSRQMEIQLADYYQWPAYWTGGIGMPLTGSPVGYGLLPISALEATELVEGEELEVEATHRDPHLQSSHAITNYRLEAVDGEVGALNDFIVDDADWSIPILVAESGNWVMGRKVLIPPALVTYIDNLTNKIALDLSKEAFEKAPEFDRLAPISAQTQEAVQAYFKSVAHPRNSSLM